MRHQKHGRKFSRTSAHRTAMFANMLSSLIVHERIETTEPKAKELHRLADRTISWGTSVLDVTAKPRDKQSVAEKARVVHAMREARKILRSDDAVSKLFGEVAARFKGRAGGYTRVLKTRVRRGDAAPMALVELVVRAEPETEAAAAPEATEAAAKPAKKKAAKDEGVAAAAEKTPKAKKAADADDEGGEKKPKAAKKAKKDE